MKGTTRSISRRRPSPARRPILGSDHSPPPGSKSCRLARPARVAHQAEFNMCRLIGCDEIRCPGLYCVAESRPPRSMGELSGGVKDAHMVRVGDGVQDVSSEPGGHRPRRPHRCLPKASGRFMETPQRPAARKTAHFSRRKWSNRCLKVPHCTCFQMFSFHLGLKHPCITNYPKSLKDLQKTASLAFCLQLPAPPSTCLEGV